MVTSNNNQGTEMESRGLQAYLRQKADSMRRAAAERPNERDWREKIEAICVADDATGVRKLRIRDWAFVSDSGPAFGGWSLGPSSPELLCGVVSTCLTHTYEIGAAMLGIPVDRIQVRVAAENNDGRFLSIPTDDPAVPFNMTAHATVEAPKATAEQIEALHEYARQCPLTNLIRQPNTVTVIPG